MADDAFNLPSAGEEEEEEVMGGLDEDEAMKDLDAGEGEDEDYFPPTMKVGEEKEIGKQGLKKKLVKEGEGWDRPETGDEVEGTCLPVLLLVVHSPELWVRGCLLVAAGMQDTAGARIEKKWCQCRICDNPIVLNELTRLFTLNITLIET